jgi:hypothetical protein
MQAPRQAAKDRTRSKAAQDLSAAKTQKPKKVPAMMARDGGLFDSMQSGAGKKEPTKRQTKAKVHQGLFS